MTTLDEDLRAVLVELCLQKQLHGGGDGDGCGAHEAEDSGRIPHDYLQCISMLTCEALFWCEYRSRRDGLVEYLRLPRDYVDRFSSAITCDGGLRIVDYCQNVLTRLFWVNRVSYAKTLLRPLDLLAGLAELYVLMELMRETSRRISAQLRADQVGPNTATVVYTMLNVVNSLTGMYNKKLLALKTRGDNQQYRSHRDFVDGSRPKTGKASASLSSSSSSSSLEADTPPPSSGTAQKSASPRQAWAVLGDVCAQQARSPRTEPDLEELHAYLAYVWAQMALNGSGSIGIEDVGSAAFAHSVLERDLLAAVKLQPPCTSVFSMILSDAIASLDAAESYTVNPLKWPMRALLSQYGHFEHNVDANTKKLLAHYAIEAPDRDCLRAMRQLLWMTTACKIARLAWERALDTGQKPADDALVRACLASTETFLSETNRRLGRLLRDATGPGPTAVAARAPAECESNMSTSEDSDETHEVGAPLSVSTGPPAQASSRQRAVTAASPGGRGAKWADSDAPTLRQTRVSIGTRSSSGAAVASAAAASRARARLGPQKNPRVPIWISGVREEDQ